MCSHFLKRMENYQQGDLTDILRASGGSKTAAEEAAAAALADWQFPAANNTVNNNINNYPTDDPVDVFGDPFSSHMGDPLLLLHGINAAAAAVPASGLFLHSSSEETGNSSSSTVGFASNIDGLIKRPNNMFSRMLQIATNPKLPLPPCDSPAAAAESPRGLVKAPDHTLIISPNSSKLGCLLESPGNLQISSPRNTGIRRRKSQAKKVVCIPAPAPANSRSSGEIVPSDLWAWRKYGQKPIKGSPYPRGYYRCSSSKGCSARKQVERSRTDPNMLVITYTSEHNHPWPTQRNALAGSTRSQPSSSSKNNNPSSSSQKSTRSNLQKHNHHHQEEHKLQEEESSTRGGGGDDTAVGGGGAVKEEEMEQDLDDHHHHLEFDDNNQGFSHIYRPTLPDAAAHHSEDSFLFADLGEIETDSLDILLTQGFSGEDDGPDSKSLDPFTFYDWASTGNNNNMISTTTTSSPATAAAGAATTTASYREPANKNNDHP